MQHIGVMIWVFPAALLMQQNYEVTRAWPLAITAYNHGTAGMLRAKESLHTDDIVSIVRRYNGRTFGFASRNFYVSFLAALDVDRNYEKYFGSMQRQGEAKFRYRMQPPEQMRIWPSFGVWKYQIVFCRPPVTIFVLLWPSHSVLHHLGNLTR